MKIYYDMEFLEDGNTIEPISIGMIREDNQSLYLVNEEIGKTIGELRKRICQNDWLMDNVIPHLPLESGSTVINATKIFPGAFYLDMDSNLVVSKRYMRNAVRDFVLGTPEPSLWAWYGAYDHVALCQLFGRMIDLPKGFPMWTNELKQEAVRLGVSEADLDQAVVKNEAEHNALADAKWNMRVDAHLGGIRDSIDRWDRE